VECGDVQKNALLSYLLRQAQLANYQQLDAVMQAFGLTPSQYIVLSVVQDHREGVFSAALARRLGITPQSSHEIVAGLEHRGLIRRVEDPAYRRAMRVSLTAKGSTLLARCNKEVEGFEAQFFGALSPEEATLFREILTKLIRDSRENSAVDSIGMLAAR
jgi:DNA-binding MarR family transcriptional regulator